MDEPIEELQEPTQEPIDENAETIVTDEPHKTKLGIFNDSVKYHLTSMYRDWFIDYASYVILDRSVPNIDDGFKPVQRRVLYAMKTQDDGRYKKVAGIVGEAMKFHPHGDASIKDALVGLGQKDILIDCQGNWGNILTGDDAAASRYIEARLTKFANEVVFNNKTTHWMKAYDGERDEPIALPIKFPLLLAQGAKGIAVTLNSIILPHNFGELCQAALSYLRGEEFQLYPDFQTGGLVDVSKYNDGERGGKIRIRAKIQKSADNKSLTITEIPYGTTTASLLQSITVAHQKGKIKIRKVEDLTAAEACIVVHLQPGTSSDKTIDALYAFTNCEVQVSPICCVIKDKKPCFTSVSYVLKYSTDHTKDLLKWELEIKKHELEEQIFFLNLEKIFIENRIYKEKQYEDAPSEETAIRFIKKALQPYLPTLYRPLTNEDILKLMDIKMRRIPKFDSKKANEKLKALDDQLKEVNFNLAHLVEYTIHWYEHIYDTYAANYPRRTEIRNFANINAKIVAEANEKLYIDRENGFVGTGLKKFEYLFNCSDIDDIIIFYKDGRYKITKVQEKAFIGKDIQHLAIYKKQDTRTIYNVVYRDGKKGVYYMKRFAATGLARDKEYNLTQGTAGSKIVYFTANPNGEAEVIRVQLKPAPHLKKVDIFKDMSELAIKSRSSRGNLLTKFEIQRITLKQKGQSTLGGRKVWFDPDILHLNYDGMGLYLGEFQSEDLVLAINKNGDYYCTNFELTAHFTDNFLRVEQYDSEKVWAAVLWNADQNYYYAKRFQIDENAKIQNFLGDNPESKLLYLTDREQTQFIVHFTDPKREPLTINIDEFITVQSPKVKGKRLTTYEVDHIEMIEPAEEEELQEEIETIEEEQEIDAITASNSLTQEAEDIPFTINTPQEAETIEETPDKNGQLSLF